MNFYNSGPLTSSSAMIVIADVGYPLIVKASNSAGIAGHATARTGVDSGIMASLEEDTNYEYASQALTKANALLKQYDFGDIVDFDTIQDLLTDPTPQWWRGGQMVTFNIPELNNTFTCLITKVTATFFASNSGGTAIKWHITCNTNMQGVDYEKWFSDILLSQSQIIINEAPAILFGLTPLETLTLTDTVTITTRNTAISPFRYGAAQWNLCEF